MGGFSFLHPALLWGALGVSVPIVIHLFSRRRFKIVEWAAIDFLFTAHRRSRKRVKMEHWLVLLLRCLALLLLALLVARPRFSPVARRGAAAALPSPTEHIVVLDDSNSMLMRGSLQTPGTRAREQFLAWMDFLREHRPNDVVTLLLSSNPDKPIYSGLEPSREAWSELDAFLSEMKTRADQPELRRAVSSLHETLSRPGPGHGRAVYFLTDLRASDWSDLSAVTTVGSDGLHALAEACNLVAVVDCGDDGRAVNCGIVGLEPEGAVVDGIPATYRIAVRNFGETPANDLVLSFGIAGGAQQQVPIARIEPQATETLLCDLIVSEREWAALEAGIGDDDLAADNMRRCGVAVLPPTRVLLVDGAGNAGIGLRESYYVHMALTPPGPVRFGYRVEVIAASELANVSPGETDIIILCDVPYPAIEPEGTLETWVREGGCLICFVGERADPVAYNRLLHRGGEGILPAFMDSRQMAVGGDDVGVSLTVVDPAHPVVSVFRGEANPFLEKIRIRRWWPTRIPDGSGSHVLCRLNDLAGSPLLLERRTGKGLAYLVVTGPDTRSGNWVSDPSFVVVVHQLATHAERRTRSVGTIRAGAPLAIPIDLDTYEDTARVERLGDEDSTQTLTAQPTEDDRLAFAYEDTGQQGWYRATLRCRDGRPEERLYAVNVPAEEGDPRPADRPAVKATLEVAGATLVDDMVEALAGARIRQRELWQPIGWLLLAVLTLEHVLSWWFLRRRAVSSDR